MARLIRVLNDPAGYGRKDDPQPPTGYKAACTDFQIKAEGGAEGVIVGYGSVFGEVDAYNEIVVKGAFKDSIKEWKERGKPIPMLWQHGSAATVGKWTIFKEDSRGLYLEGKLNLETQRGKEAWSDVKEEIVTGLSIGYFELEADAYQYGPDAPPRKLRKLSLREVSVVTFPANREAQIDAVKARLMRGEKPTQREVEMMLSQNFPALSRADRHAIMSKGFNAWLLRDAAPGGEKAEDFLRDLRGEVASFALPDLG